MPIVSDQRRVVSAARCLSVIMSLTSNVKKVFIMFLGIWGVDITYSIIIEQNLKLK